jgi:hypothetical protein
MIPKPTLQDIKTIGYYTGRIIVRYGFLMAIPIFVSFIMGEYDEGINFFIRATFFYNCWLCISFVLSG